jgi:hypothetical protein
MIFQIDTTGIRPGDSISQAACEAAIGRKCDDSKDWQFSLLKLLGIVQNQIRKEHGRELTVRIDGNSLHVLSDREASEYNPKRFLAGLKLARRAHRRLLAVNVSKLTAAEKTSHAKAVAIQAHKLSMLRGKTEIPLTGTVRTTPVMSWDKK